MRFLTHQSGATLIEYAVIALAIVIAMLVALSFVGTGTTNHYNNVTTKVNSAMH